MVHEVCARALIVQQYASTGGYNPLDLRGLSTKLEASAVQRLPGGVARGWQFGFGHPGIWEYTCWRG